MCNFEGVIVRHVLGIDQSYTSAGFVVMDESGEVKKFGTIRSNADTNGDIFDRAAFVTRSIIDIANEYDPALVGLEGLAFSKFGNATRDLAGLQFVLITQMRTTKYGSNMVIISPNLVKKFATGKGSADKAAMVEAMPESLVDEIKEANYKKTTGLYDIADAYWIAKYTLEEYKKSQK